MRRRGLEPPPGYPGPGPQPGAGKCRSVQILQERPDRLVAWTIWTHQTIWMLPRMLPRLASATGGAAALSLGAARSRFAFLALVHPRSDLLLANRRTSSRSA